ncbi:MAG: ABC transporter ATP-binding protein [Thermoplasmatales archaeon]|nr:ABC transporter ATP-binding protein [Thermoplasmatales archaeon]
MTFPIEIRNLSAGYDGTPVIENIDLTLRENDFLAVVGPNGGGKTTLFRCILGLLSPMSGSVSIYGKPPDEASPMIGYVPQKSEFDTAYPIKVRDVVLMGMRHDKGLRPRYSKEQRERAAVALEIAGMSDFSETRVSDLSGGQLQRVFLARALAPEPPILLLDEPTASLDPQMKDCIHDVLREINDEVSIIMITHDIGNLSRDVKRVACLNRRIIVNDEPVITKDMFDLGYHCPPEHVHVGDGCSCEGVSH